MSDSLELIQRALPAYAVGDEIGKGGFGHVFRATHLRLGRHVGIKQLPTSFAENEDVRKRFVTEAKVLATLDHPHIVPLYDYVEDDGLCLLVMELLSGGTLWERLDIAPLTLAEACAIAIAAASGLGFAHSRGVLHRDVKPGNLMFSSEGVLKVVDFGLAKVMGGTESMATAAGAVLGSPRYMAPEQITGAPLTGATDIYALGTVLYELLSGRLPFPEEKDQIAYLVARARLEATPLGEVADVPGAIAETVMRALEVRSEDRFETAEAFGRAIARAANHALGPGWLAGSMTSVYAGGELQAALDGAHSGTPDPMSVVLLPQPQSKAETPPEPPRPSLDPRSLVPVREMIEADQAASDEARHQLSHHEAPGAVPEMSGEMFLVVDLFEPQRDQRRIKVKQSATFGRQCDGVNLADPEISRNHFRIDITESSCRLIDVGSTNGTFVNGARIDGAVAVQPGDLIRIGYTTLQVVGGTMFMPVSPIEASTAPLAGLDDPATIVSGPGDLERDQSFVPADVSPVPTEPSLLVGADVLAPEESPCADGSSDEAAARPTISMVVLRADVPELVTIDGASASVSYVRGTWAELVASSVLVEIEAARLQLAGFGLEATLGPLQMQLVDPVRPPAPGLRPVGRGTFIVPADGRLSMVCTAETGADPAIYLLTLLFGDAVGASQELRTLLDGLALYLADAPNPLATIAPATLPLLADAPATMRAAIARCLCEYLVAMAGVPALLWLASTTTGDSIDYAMMEVFGADLDTVERNWRSAWPIGGSPGGGMSGAPQRSAPYPSGTADDRTASTLRRVPFLNTLSPAELESVIDAMRPGSLRAGETAAEGGWLALIESGSASIVRPSGLLAGSAVSSLGVGDVFGAADAIGAPHGLRLRSDDDVSMLVLDPEPFRTLRNQIGSLERSLDASALAPMPHGVWIPSLIEISDVDQS